MTTHIPTLEGNEWYRQELEAAWQQITVVASSSEHSAAYLKLLHKFFGTCSSEDIERAVSEEDFLKVLPIIIKRGEFAGREQEHYEILTLLWKIGTTQKYKSADICAKFNLTAYELQKIDRQAREDLRFHLAQNLYLYTPRERIIEQQQYVAPFKGGTRKR